MECVNDTIYNRGMGLNAKFNDHVPAQMKETIMRTLNGMETDLYSLSEQGWAKYGVEESWMDSLQFLVQARGERTHWYAFWAGWSD